MNLLGQRDALVNQMNQMGTFILDSDRQNLVEFNIIINFCVYASDVNDPTEPGLFSTWNPIRLSLETLIWVFST